MLALRVTEHVRRLYFQHTTTMVYFLVFGLIDAFLSFKEMSRQEQDGDSHMPSTSSHSSDFFLLPFSAHHVLFILQYIYLSNPSQ
jgi:hypothetical protein